MNQPTPELNPNIQSGNATIVGTETGWALPGRQHTRSKAHAERVAQKIDAMMRGIGK